MQKGDLLLDSRRLKTDYNNRKKVLTVLW